MNKNDLKENEYISEEEAKEIKKLFEKFIKCYKEKDISMSDEEWLEQLYLSEIPGIDEETAKYEAENTMDSINEFNENYKSVNESAQKGISKERWIADKIQEASVGMAVNEYGQKLQAMDNILYQKNIELENALQRSSDGHIKMSPNIDGNIAENMISKTTELSTFLQDKNIKVEVRNAFTENSIDVRAINLDNGKYQNYQLKFGKDAQTTISLIERGNYGNQRIIVPTEQLDEVKAHFKAKGSVKNISDHIDAWGAKGKSFTKEEMKQLQLSAQEDGIMPTMDYSHYQTKDLAISIGKNASAMALQSAAVTTGLNIAKKIVDGEKIDVDEMVETALKTGVDTSLKVVTAGTLQVGIRKGIIKFIPKSTPAGVIANISCVGIENIKIIAKIASGEMSLTKGLDQMGRVTTAMVGGLWGMAKGTLLGVQMTFWIPVIGAPLSVVSGFVGGMIGYFAGSKFGDIVYNTGKKIANTAKKLGKVIVSELKSTGRTIVNGIKAIGRAIFS